ncbi:MAG: deoxyribose-phosphate aldolase [Limisphaerales bacterium]
MTEIPLNRRIELIALRPDAIRSELETLFKEAREYGCQVVCVTGSRVELAVACLEESPVKVAALVGFPFGAGDPDVKRYEVEVAVDGGVHEIQCVVNPGWLREGLDKALLRELRDIREAAEERPVTAIVEAGMVGTDGLRRAVELVREAELQFLATATGCAARPTTPEEVRDLRDWAGPELGLTAVGGIYTAATALALVEAGANRVGVFSLAPLQDQDSGRTPVDEG